MRVAFRYAFRLQSMQDKENMLAVSYGLMPLAFESHGDVILGGDRNKVLQGLSAVDG